MANENVKLENSKQVSFAQLTKGEKQLLSSGYRLTGGNPTSYTHLIAYATKPVTHADAQTIGKALFEVRKIGVPFSNITCWHTTPASKPRIYKTKNLARYSANYQGYLFGTVRFACIEHKLNRMACAKTCLQGLFDIASEKFLGQMAGTYNVTPKAKRTSKATSKRKNQKATTTPN